MIKNDKEENKWFVRDKLRRCETVNRNFENDSTRNDDNNDTDEDEDDYDYDLPRNNERYNFRRRIEPSERYGKIVTHLMKLYI